MTSVLIERGIWDTETRSAGEHSVQMKADIGVRHLQAEQGLLAFLWKLRERHGADPSSQPSEETNPADTLISACKALELARV